MKSYRNLASIDAIKLLNLPSYPDQNGILTVLDNIELIPFKICRVFTISAEKNSIRGRHAHKTCSQLLISVCGDIEVFCDDGCKKSKYVLDRANLGLFIPPGIWAQETYKKDDSILMVLCDLPYDIDDYINNIEHLRTLKQDNNDK